MRLHDSTSSDALPPERPQAFAAWSGAIVAVAALALGGATSLWAQIIVAFAVGALLVVFPPKRPAGLLPAGIAVLLAGIAAAAFAPDRWLGIPPWKENLLTNLGIGTPLTRTPQPVVTAEALALFIVGMCWTYWTLSLNWGRRLRVRVCRGVVIGVGVLAFVAAYAFYSGASISLWEQAENRGFFPNRNQMADVLVLAGILNYALLHEGLRRREWLSLAWLLSLTAIGAGLVVSYSRAGIILFFAGILVWNLASFLRRRSLEKAGVATAVLVGAVALFMIFGSTTLERFAGPVNGGSQASAMNVLQDFRIVVQQDAIRFSRQSPWLGVGLGNFSPLFTMERQQSAMANTTLHPESDWLWAACELGWPAVLLLLIALGWWAWKCVRMAGDDEEWSGIRVAAALGVMLFVLHGLVDVSGHRLGSAMFAMLLAGLAMPLHERPALRFAPQLIRAAGLLPILIASWWLASLQGYERWPSSATVAQREINIRNATDADDFNTVYTEADSALGLAQLSSSFYVQRGYANLALGGELSESQADFGRAIALQPAWPDLTFDIGTIWLNAGERDLVLNAWTLTLQRAGDAAPNFFRRMLETARDTPTVRSSLRNAAFQDLKFLFVSLQNATPEEARTDIASYLLEEPELAPLTEEQRSTFLTLWWQKGNREALLKWLEGHPETSEKMWELRAEALAQQKRFQQAMELVARSMKPPAVPMVKPGRTRGELEAAFLLHPDDFVSGFMLYELQLSEKRDEDAIFTLRKLAAIPGRPPFIFWLQAQLYARHNGWPEAWNAWQQYRANTP